MSKLNLSKIKCVVFDLDGTIYFGEKLAENANELISLCRRKFDYIFFATNNSSITRESVYKRLENMGVDVRIGEVVNSAYIAAKYLQEHGFKEIYCMGTDGLRDEIALHGINAYSKTPEAIVIGYDIMFNLDKLEEAINIYRPECKIVVTNKERTYPRDGGVITPGAGAAVSAFEYTVNRQADVIVGKPSVKMLEIITSKLNLEPENILMVGDSFESDYTMAKAFGAQSILIENTDEHYDVNCSVKNLTEIMEILT